MSLTQDFSNLLLSWNKLPFPSVAALNTTNKISTGFNTYYKMEGFNTNTNNYENWHSMGTPLLIPPSGNSLINISVVTSWIDR